MIPDCVEKDGSHHPEVIAGNSSVTMIAAKIEQKFFGLKKMCFFCCCQKKDSMLFCKRVTRKSFLKRKQFLHVVWKDSLNAEKYAKDLQTFHLVMFYCQCMKCLHISKIQIIRLSHKMFIFYWTLYHFVSNKTCYKLQYVRFLTKNKNKLIFVENKIMLVLDWKCYKLHLPYFLSNFN